MRDTDGYRHCDRCGAILTRENNKCGYEICDKCNEYLDDLGKNNPKTGHWISHYDEDAKCGWYECDRCHTERAFNTDYCPDCGAKMVEPQESEE